MWLTAGKSLVLVKTLAFSWLILFSLLLVGCAQVQNNVGPLTQSVEPAQPMSEYDRWIELNERLPTELGVDGRNAGLELEFMASEGPTNQGGVAQVYFTTSQEEYDQDSLYTSVWEKIGTVVKLANEYELGTTLHITAEITTKFLAGGEINTGSQPILMVSLDEKAREAFPLEPCQEDCELLVSSYDFNPIEDMTWLSDPKNGETLSPKD